MNINFPSRETVVRIRKQYPVGCRVELLRMDDPQAPPIGTKGTVRYVDDIGSLGVAWDNGSSLQVVYGEDLCRKLEDADGGRYSVRANSRRPGYRTDKYVRYLHRPAHCP